MLRDSAFRNRAVGHWKPLQDKQLEKDWREKNQAARMLRRDDAPGEGHRNRTPPATGS